MRILHLLATGLYSGAENVALTMMAALPEYETVYASPDGPIRQVVESRGQKYFALESTSIGAVKKAISAVKPDIIHAHDPRMSCLAALAAPWGMKIVSHLHNDPDWLSGVNFNTLSYHLCAGRFAKIAAVSGSVVDKMILSKRFRKKWLVLPNCVDLTRVKNLAQEDAPQTDILAVGRLSEQKDPVGFLQILSLLEKRGVSFRAAMVGDGELRSDCEAAVRELGLEDTVTLAGFRENPYAWMARTKVLVMPSKWEGFGLVAVEALGLGVPVVCSGAGGLKDIVDESCGAVCGGIKAHADEIQHLLENDTLREEKGRAALQRAQIFTDMRVYQARLIELYKVKQ